MVPPTAHPVVRIPSQTFGSPGPPGPVGRLDASAFLECSRRWHRCHQVLGGVGVRGMKCAAQCQHVRWLFSDTSGMQRFPVSMASGHPPHAVPLGEGVTRSRTRTFLAKLAASCKRRPKWDQRWAERLWHPHILLRLAAPRQHKNKLLLYYILPAQNLSQGC